jgi:phosphotriesterase-related protein
MSHLDRTLQDKEKLLEFARMGCIMEYDHFGNEISHCQVSLFIIIII